MGTKKIAEITGGNKTEAIQEFKCLSVKKEVLSQILAKRIKIRRPLVFIAKRLGFESALLLSILAGSFFVSAILAVFQRKGWSAAGMWSEMPYHYLAFLAVSVSVTIFFADQVELHCGKCKRTVFFGVSISAVIIVIGAIFFLLGAGKILSGWLSL